jgi:hypothetical protein
MDQRAMHLFFLLISFSLVFAAAAIADPDTVPETVTPSTTSDAKPSAPTEAVKKPKSPADSELKAAGMSPAEIREKSDTYYKQCMNDWDAATHMTKKEWQRTCRRITDERANFIVDQLGK